MKYQINTIPQIYRNVRRWTEIISVLSKFGLADWISRLNVEFVKDSLKSSGGEALARLSHESRVRLAMTRLGPTFIKVGQILSTRADVIGLELASELEQLQSDLPADPFDEVKTTVETELGRPLSELFNSFSETPIASASIGQVHSATLHDGTEVVVKVQHSDIEKTIENDLEIMSGVAQLAERIEDWKVLRPKMLVAELSRTMLRELDFQREKRSLVQFHDRFHSDPTIKIPQVYPEFCTSRVLTMERIEGTKLSKVEQLRNRGIDLEAIARRGANAYLTMIFDDGFFHADPHPGNLLVCQDESLAILDFGMVGRISERIREDIEEMLLSIVNNDVESLTAIIIRVGSIPPTLDEAELSRDVADFVGQYTTQSISKLDLSSALHDMTTMIRRHRIFLPGEAALLIKVLMTLEGTARLIWPDISVMEVMKPLQRKMILKRLSPARQYRKLRRMTSQFERVAEVVPQRLVSILDQMQKGKFDVHLDHRRLGPSVNRMVVGMITSALFLGSSWILSSEVPPLLFPEQPFFGIHRLSMIGLFGIIVSSFLAMRLIWAIRKSGNLDQKERD